MAAMVPSHRLRPAATLRAPPSCRAPTTAAVRSYKGTRAAKRRAPFEPLSARHALKGRQLRAQDVRTSTSSTDEDSSDDATDNSVPVKALAAAVGASALLAAAAATQTGGVEGLEAVLGLAKSGFSAAFSLIFISEIGDKTFFIAALLAMRRGRAAVFTGAVGALALMTVISVLIGRIFHAVPPSLTQGLPIDDYLAVALLLFFGVKSIRDAAASNPEEGDGELADAEEALKEAGEDGGAAAQRTAFLATVARTFSLIFVAEWGDRSMLATVALGAAQSPVGVATGAIVGHALATLIAIAGGSVLSKYVSEKTVGYVGGVLFLLFALLTALGLY